MDYLPGDEFGDREPDDVHGAVEVGDDAPYLRAGQAVRLGAQAEDDLVAVDGVDVEVAPLRGRPGIRYAGADDARGELRRDYLAGGGIKPEPTASVRVDAA